MRTRFIHILFAAVTFGACTPDPVITPNTPPTPTQNGTVYLVGIGISATTNVPVMHITGHPELISYWGQGYSYDTTNYLLKNIIYVGAGYSRGWAVTYNSSLQPVGGKKTYSNSMGTSGNSYVDTDSLIYKINDGNITQVIFCNGQRRSPTPFGNFTSTDTSTRINISYQNGNPVNIHVMYRDGSGYDLDYTWGNKKSPFSMSRMKYLVNPDDDNFTNSNLFYAAMFSTNELLSQQLTRWGTSGYPPLVEKSDYVYTYNDSGYPITYKISMSNGQVYNGVFVYQ